MWCLIKRNRKIRLLIKRTGGSRGCASGRGKSGNLEGGVTWEEVDDTNRALLSGFAERWHRDTCSFHLSVGEMTITLDDVSSLLHLPVTSRFFSLPAIGKDEANMMLGNLDVAARAYLLHLVGCTIFADKSGTLVRDVSFYNTRQITGYMTLLQAWIYKHFPYIVPRRPNSSYEEGRPLSKRWAPLRGTGEVALVRQSLDRLTHTEVTWMPYEGHRVYRLFHDVSWYRGYITYGSIVFPHLPERVIRQYGHIQSIPPSPHDAFPEHLLEEVYRGPVMTIPGECADDYLRWYHWNSTLHAPLNPKQNY
ncbi:Aminotransferase-like, plant mobile domain [Sesbania bispinosa]|nr:Aminotransferase-like, plant mobile domain [Sesbania bispinosa]